MSAQAALPTNRTEIASIVIPTATQGLLLPNESVAEVIESTPVMGELNSPKWFAGYVYWRERLVPCVDLGVMLQGEATAHDDKFRVVLNYTGLSDTLPFVVITASSAPSVLRITEDAIEKMNTPIESDALLMHVLAAGRELAIPNVRYLEEKLIDAGYVMGGNSNVAD